MLLSALLTIIIFVITLIGTFAISAMNEISSLNNNIAALPQAFGDRLTEVEREYGIYRSDFKVCGDLAKVIYDEYGSLGAKERLNFVSQNVNAINVTLLDHDGQVLASTSGGQPSSAITQAFAARSGNDAALFDPNLVDSTKQAGDDQNQAYDGTGAESEYDYLPMVYGSQTSDGNILMVEFDYTAFSKVLENQVSWEEICQRALAGMEGYAFLVQSGGIFNAYPHESFDKTVTERLTCAHHPSGRHHPLHLRRRHGHDHWLGKHCLHCHRHGHPRPREGHRGRTVLHFEGTLSVGDIVEVGSWRGRVTDMGVRTTEITNDQNDVKIFTNSKIGEVVNLSKVKTACTEEFTIPRTVEVSKLPDLVSEYIEKVVEDVPEIKDSLELKEITSITDDSYSVSLSYLVNESDREPVTIRLRNAMLSLVNQADARDAKATTEVQAETANAPDSQEVDVDVRETKTETDCLETVVDDRKTKIDAEDKADDR